MSSKHCLNKSKAEQRVEMLGFGILLLVGFDLGSRDLWPELIHTSYVFWSHSIVLAALLGTGLYQSIKLYWSIAKNGKNHWKKLKFSTLAPFSFLLVVLIYSGGSILGASAMNSISALMDEHPGSHEHAQVMLYGWQQSDNEEVRKNMAKYIFGEYGVNVQYKDDNGVYQSRVIDEEQQSFYHSNIEHEASIEQTKRESATTVYNAQNVIWLFQLTWFFTFLFSVFADSQSTSKTAPTRFGFTQKATAVLCLTGAFSLYFVPAGADSSHKLALMVLAVTAPVGIVFTLRQILLRKTRIIGNLMLIMLFGCGFLSAANYIGLKLGEDNSVLTEQSFIRDTMHRGLLNMTQGSTQAHRKLSAQALYHHFGLALEYRIDDGEYRQYQPTKGDVEIYRETVRQKSALLLRKQVAGNRVSAQRQLFLSYCLVLILSFGLAIWWVRKRNLAVKAALQI